MTAAIAPKPAAPALPKARDAAPSAVPVTSVLYIGPPKSGKTTCALSWPDPFVFDFGSNLAGLHGQLVIPPHILGKDLGDTSAAILAKLEQLVLPAIANGRIAEMTDRPVRTIVFEDLTYLFSEHLDKAVRGPKEALSGFDDYGTFLHKAENLTLRMTDLTLAGFNVVATVHLGEEGGKDIMQKVNDKWEKVGSTPIKRRPIIPGKFRDILCGRFENALLTQRHISKQIIKGAAADVVEFYVYTINPDTTYEGIGEGFGRPGGRFKPLPPKTDGRYPQLAKAWGIDE